MSKINGMIGGSTLCWVDGSELWYDGFCYGQVTDSRKQMVRMGAKIILFPDKVAFNTETHTLEALEQKNAANAAEITPCKADGSAMTAVFKSDSPPTEPQNGQLWLDTREDGGLKEYDAINECWNAVTNTAVRIAAAGIGAGLKGGDGVTVSGTGVVDGDRVLNSAEEDAVVLPGLLTENKAISGVVRVERCVPDLTLVTELNNRLWGTTAEGHEILACKLGDPANWHVFSGISTDSYAVNVGSDGAFTGVCSHMGYALFFKEGWLHRLYGSTPANFQLTSTMVCGVETGAERTMKVIGDVLYYKGVDGVYAFDGSLPVSVSWDLGDERRRGLCAAAFRGRYVISMKGDDGQGELLCYDPHRAMWHREDAIAVSCMAQAGIETYLVLPSGWIAGMGGTMTPYGTASSVMEEAVQWQCETPRLTMKDAAHKYIVRLKLRVRLAAGSELDAAMQYDEDGQWHQAAHLTGSGAGTAEIVLFPRRCDVCRIRLSGTGDMTLFSLLREMQPGR